MIYSQLFHLTRHAAPALKTILCLALVLGLSPLVTSNAAVAQGAAKDGVEVMHPAMVNINTADAKSLAAGLKGIGQSRAEDIVRYRETYGPFASIEELTAVKGVGKSTLEKNRHVLSLE